MLLDFFKSSVLDLDKIQEKKWPRYRFYFDEETEAQRGWDTLADDASKECSQNVNPGQPKPEVTWYKNGRAIDECGIVSSYEFFQNQYIHLLHLYRCTPGDTAVYQISAKNCSGMICCSASLEVKCSAENPQLSPNPKDGGDTGWKHATESSMQEEANQLDEKEHPRRGEESVPSGSPMSADSASSTFGCSCSLRLLANNDTGASGSENPLDVKGARRTEEARDPDSTEEVADGWLFSESSSIPDKQHVCCHRAVHSEGSRPVDGALNSDGPLEDVFKSGHPNPRVQKYISFSLPLAVVATSDGPGDRATIQQQGSPQGSSEDSDSDYELCPEITLTCTEEFSDDDLEYLECSDVMTDYSNAVWQRDLQGTGQVFLLESNDEEMEFGSCGPGGREHFLSEMGCGPRVSDDMGPMDATSGFCGNHSQPQEVGVRSSQASTHSPSSLQTGMTLTLGPHRDVTSTVTDQARCKLPTASEAAENDYPGIQRETRDSHQAGEEFTSDNLLNMDKAVTETAMKRLSGELENSGVDQWLEIAAEKKVGDEVSLSKRGSEIPAGVRRSETEGEPKKLSPNLKESTTEDTLNLLYPKEPVKRPVAQSDKRDSPHAKAKAVDWNSQFRAGECAVPAQAEQEAKTLRIPLGPPRQGGNSNFEGEGVLVSTLFETSGVPDGSAHPQVQIQEPVRGRDTLSRMPAFSEPAGEPSAPPGTTTNSFPNLGGIDEEYASLAGYLELESCTRCPQHRGNQDRKDRALGSSWEDLGHELSIPDASHENRAPRELSALLPQEGSADPGEPKPLSVASPEPTDTITTLETAGGGPRGREAACVLELLEARGQRTRPTTDSPAGASPDKYSPHEICSTDLESAKSQSEVSDLCSPDDKTPGVLFQTRGSEPPQPPCKSAKERDSAMPPLFTSVFTWNLSQKASEGGTGKNLAAVENFTSTLVSTVQAGQERPGPSNSGGLEEKQPLRSENSSFVQLAEGGNKGPSNGGPDTTDTSARNGSGVTFPRETPTTFTAHLEGLQVARESGDTWPPVTMAPKVHPAKYLPVSIAENSLADGPKGSSPQAPDENILHLTSHAQLGHILSDSKTESLKEPFGMAPRGPGVPIHIPRLPEVEGFCSSRPLQTDDQSGDKSLTVDRADNRSLEEDFQEKERERTQRIQHESLPPQSFASEGGFQERWPMTAVAQGAIHPVPLDHLSANSREESGQSSDLGPTVCKVAHATVEDDGQALSHTPPLSDIFLEGSRESGPGLWKAGRKLKIITLEAPISEDWLPRPQTGSECKELEAGPVIPDRVWALSDVLKAHSPQAESGPALANNRETHVSEKRASRAYWSSLSSRYLSQPRLLESSVDPVDGKELPVTDLSSETSKTGEKENVSHVSQNREENQIKDHADFLKQFLTCPKVVESSVDPADEAGVMVCTRAGTPGPSESTPAIIREESKLNDGNMGQRLEVQPAILQVPRPDEGGETIPSGCGISQIQEGRKRSLGEAEQSKNNKAEPVFSTSPPSNCLAVMTHASVGVDSHNSTGQVHDVPENDLVEPRNHQYARSDSKEREAVESECGKPSPSSSGLAPLPCASSPKGNTANFSVSHTVREPQREEPHTGETKHVSTSGSPAVTSASGSGECSSEKAPKILQHPCQQGSNLGCGRRPREENLGHTAARTLRFPKAPPAGSGSEEVKKPETSAGGHLAEGVKKKILSRVAALRLRLEEKENVLKSSSFLKKIPKLETPASCTEEEKDAKKPPCKREGKAPILLKKIQAEMFPDHSGNVKLSCQFAEIHEDSTVWWTKDSKSVAQVQRRADDTSAVSLAIVQAGQKDQGIYRCCIKNSYGKATAEFNLTAEVLKQLASQQDIKGCEEIEFSQLIFREDFLRDSYFGDHLRGQIATEELHFGEGVHRKAFRSKVMQGLMPVFQPGHACVLKVHNAVAYGTRNNDELIQRNYKLAAQECYVQNTARYYAKIYAAEAQPLEGFGEVPEIIPIFLIHRPENNIPYATVEEELIGEFVKYSIRDGKEINFLRRESEAGQKCCTFQHWVYQRTSGCLLVTDMQGVGMKLTDVGIATLAKGYKGFKGNCSMTFIDQFKALHQCNKYCKMLGLTSLQNNSQKQKKPAVTQSRIQPNATTVKKMASGSPAGKETSHPL
uniref:non-specific serine/threonine protein kinase n=1 Tax=Felis catus TaxID=9685 RepID=A0ABI7Z4I9_FELCA